MDAIVTFCWTHRCHRHRSEMRWTCCSQVYAAGLAQGAPDCPQAANRRGRAAAVAHGSVNVVAGATMEAAYAVVRKTEVEAEVHGMELWQVSWSRTQAT